MVGQIDSKLGALIKQNMVAQIDSKLGTLIKGTGRLE